MDLTHIREESLQSSSFSGQKVLGIRLSASRVGGRIEVEV